MSGSEEMGDSKFGSLTGKDKEQSLVVKTVLKRLDALENQVKVLTECVDALLEEKE